MNLPAPTSAPSPPTAAPEHGDRGSLLSDAMVSAAGALGSVGISGIASILIARELGVTARGRWAVIASLASLVATFAALGLPATAGYAAARADSSRRSRVVQATMLAALALGLLAGVVYLIAAWIVDPPAETLVVIVAMMIPLSTVLYQVAHSLTLTVASIRWFSAAQLAGAIFTMLAVVVLGAFSRLTVLAVIVIVAAAQLVGLGSSVLATKRYGALTRPLLIRGPRALTQELRPYFGYAIITFATLSLTQIVQRVDVLLVGGYRGAHSAGLYAVAVQVNDLILVVPAALGFVMFRRGARSSPEHWPDVLRVLRWTLGFGIAAAVVCWVTAGLLVPLLFGSSYRGSVPALRWLLPGAAAFSVQSVLSAYVASRGRPRVVLVAWLIGSVVGVGADLFVIPADGIVGAAVVSSVSYLVVAGLHVNALMTVRPRDPDRPGRGAPGLTPPG